MKRFALTVGLLLSTFACSGAAVVEEPATPAVATDRLDEAAVSAVPSGSFASVEAFCDAQRQLAEPRIAEAKEESAKDGMGDLDIAPSCEESASVLATAKLILAAGVRDVKAVTVESGRATETYLVARTSAGWTAIRTPFLAEEHNDPGCPSIERASAIDAVRIDHGMVVVENDAGRMWLRGDETGDLTLTYARTCTIGAACGDAVVVAAKVATEPVEGSDAPASARFFSTTYKVDRDGVVLPAKSFDESTL